MTYEQIIDNLSSKMESRYGKIEGKRMIKEIHKAEYDTFDCTYEYLIAGDLYTLSVWGDYDYYVWKVNKLLSCESVDNRP